MMMTLCTYWCACFTFSSVWSSIVFTFKRKTLLAYTCLPFIVCDTKSRAATKRTCELTFPLLLEFFPIRIIFQRIFIKTFFFFERWRWCFFELTFVCDHHSKFKSSWPIFRQKRTWNAVNCEREWFSNKRFRKFSFFLHRGFSQWVLLSFSIYSHDFTWKDIFFRHFSFKIGSTFSFLLPSTS